MGLPVGADEADTQVPRRSGVDRTRGFAVDFFVVAGIPDNTICHFPHRGLLPLADTCRLITRNFVAIVARIRRHDECKRRSKNNKCEKLVHGNAPPERCAALFAALVSKNCPVV